MFSSLLIEASAGSGKTYQLSNRYLAILALGQDPSDLISLTFTKKAAGEFSRRIMNRLAEGASNSESAEALARDLTPTLIGDSSTNQPGISTELPNLSQEHFQDLLVKLISSLDKLQLSTLDSFYTRLVSSFAPELGLAGFDMLDQERFALAREQTLQEVLNGNRLTGKQRDLFIQSFIHANYGNEEARVRDSILQFVESHHERLLRCPNEKAWGNGAMLWHDFEEWNQFDKVKFLALLQQAEDELPESFGHKTLDKTVLKTITELQTYTPGTPLPKACENLFKWVQSLSSDGAEIHIIYYKKERIFPQRFTQNLLEIATTICQADISIYLRRTKGVWAVVQAFENQYHEQMRSQGRVSFADLTLLLEWHSVLSEKSGFNALAYRLDSQFKHWLLDEFQDTSRSQWRVIQPVIEEVMVDPDGERSLFVVGDTKQSIYGWRGGEPRLFDEISHREDWQTLQRWTMAKSWRSSQVVLDFINLCCESESAGMSIFPRETLDRWHFEKHISARELSGEVAVYQVSPKVEDGEELSQKEAAILAELERTRPIERNLSCAIIVTSNKQVQEYALLLREHTNVPVQTESAVTIASDSPLGLTLLDWFRSLLYPADKFARSHVSLSPLIETIQSVFGEDYDSCIVTARREISIHGISHHLINLSQNITVELGDFQKMRLEQIIALARKFDEQGGSLEEWLRLLENQTHNEDSQSGAVQIMTVHKSKGLEFDVVILPELDGDKYDSINRMSILTKEDALQCPEHYLIKPNKNIIEYDEVLNGQYHQWIANNCFERACNLYVALSRSARALYLFLDEPTQSARTTLGTRLTDADWVRRSIGDIDSNEIESNNKVTRLFHSGSSTWFEEHAIQYREPAASSSEVLLPEATPRKGRATASDSKQANKQTSARASYGGREFGNRIHALFESIETLADESRLPKDSYGKVIRKALSLPEAQTWFNPTSNTEVIREQAIEAIDENGIWFSGVIDRALLHKPPQGTVESISILDYKTDNVSCEEELIEQYTPQLTSYAKALADAYSISISKISMSLYSTKLECFITI